MNDGQSTHRGKPNRLELPIGLWTLCGVGALLAGIFVFDDTGWRFAIGIGLFGVSMTGFYLAVRLIRRGYPDIEGD